MRTLIFAIGFLTSTNLTAQILLTEVMFDPAGSESSDEFIEIYNAGQQPVDLTDYLVGDQDAQEPLYFPDGVTLLQAGQYAVIFDLDYFESSGAYQNIIPASALQIAVDDGTIGSGGLLNSQAETIIVRDAAQQIVARYTYSPGNLAGYSDEKVALTADDRAENWRDSLRENGTPGAINSVSPKEIDLVLSAAEPFSSPPVPRMDDTIRLHFLNENIGSQASPAAILQINIRDSLHTFTEHIRSLAPGEVEQSEVQWQATVAGRFTVRASILLQADQDLANNTIERVVAVGWPRNSVVINEIMFQPQSGEPEWIEIANRLDRPIELNGWQVRDAAGGSGTVTAGQPVLLAAGELAVLCADLSIRNIFEIPEHIPVLQPDAFPVLNNAAETLALLDASQSQIDSTAYSGTAVPEAGLSLERVHADSSSLDATNWRASTAAAGATPGMPNSVSPVQFDLAIAPQSLAWQPQKPTRGDPISFVFVIENVGREQAMFEIFQVFADRNADTVFTKDEVIFRQEIGQPLAVGQRQAVAWQWQPQRAGRLAMQIMVEAAADLRPANNVQRFVLPVGYLPGDVVLNEIMAAPVDGESEWIEILNISAEQVDLQGWQIADASNISEPIEQEALLQPGEMLLLAMDERITQFTEKLVKINGWPALNNDEDSLYLLDFHQTTIDSFHYILPSGILPGTSLERINPQLPASEPGNWGPSVSVRGATPGETNSIFTEIVPAQSALAVHPNPFSPDADGIDDFAIISYDLPLLQSRVNLTIYDLRGRVLRRLLNNAPSGATRQLIWDGTTDDGRQLPIGLYIVYLQAIDAGNGKIERLKETVVLAKRH